MLPGLRRQKSYTTHLELDLELDRDSDFTTPTICVARSTVYLLFFSDVISFQQSYL